MGKAGESKITEPVSDSSDTATVVEDDIDLQLTKAQKPVARIARDHQTVHQVRAETVRIRGAGFDGLRGKGDSPTVDVKDASLSSRVAE